VKGDRKGEGPIVSVGKKRESAGGREEAHERKKATEKTSFGKGRLKSHEQKQPAKGRREVRQTLKVNKKNREIGTGGK